MKLVIYVSLVALALTVEGRRNLSQWLPPNVDLSQWNDTQGNPRRPGRPLWQKPEVEITNQTSSSEENSSDSEENQWEQPGVNGTQGNSQWQVSDANNSNWTDQTPNQKNSSNSNGSQWQQPGVNDTQGNSQTSNESQWQVPNANSSNWPSQTPNQENSSNSNQNQWQQPSVNETQGNSQTSNESQWQVPNANNSKWSTQTPTNQENASNSNENQWKRPSLNKTQLLQQLLNSDGAKNRTQWLNIISQRNSSQQPSLDRTLNNTIWNQNRRNRSSSHKIRARWVPVSNTKLLNITTPSGDVIIGQLGYYDHLIFNQTYRKESRWWSGREKIIVYPTVVKGNPRENITAIRIYNKFLDGLNSRAEVLAGGVGYRFVKIRLSSPRNKGFKYSVQLFGR